MRIALSTRLEAGRAVKPLDAAILRLPHISNFTDFMPLEQHPLLGVRYVQSPRQLDTPDVVILPGTKTTIDDLLWLRQCGLEAAVLKLAAQGTPVLGAVRAATRCWGTPLPMPDGEETRHSLHLARAGASAHGHRVQLRKAACARPMPPPRPSPLPGQS